MLSQILTTTPSTFTPSFLIPYNISPNDSSDSLPLADIPQYPKKAGKWTIEEDELLKKYVSLYGEKQWRKISDHIPGRTSIQCLHRWSKILRPGLVKGPWTPEEDQKLIAWVKAEGPNKWAQAASVIEGRSGKQCRERWFNNLNPDVKKGEWSKEEDELIFSLYQKYGSSWSKIAKFVPGRTENSIKNRFYSTLRKISADRKKSKGNKSSPSESSPVGEEDNDDEDSSKANGESSSTEQLPHTLYKLLQESNIMEEEKEDQGENNGHLLTPNKTLSSMTIPKGDLKLNNENEPPSVFRKNSLQSTRTAFSFGGDKAVLERDCSTIVRKTSENSVFSGDHQLEREDPNQHFEKFLLAMNKKVKENCIIRELEPNVKPDNLHSLGLVQQKIANYCQNNIRTLAGDINRLYASCNNVPISCETSPPHVMSIPSLPSLQSPAPKKEKLSLKKKGFSDLSNPIELKFEDNSDSFRSPESWKSMDIPKLAPLNIPSAFKFKANNQSNQITPSYTRASSDICSVSSKMILSEGFKPALNESRNMSHPIVSSNNNRSFNEKSDLSGFITGLVSRKQVSQGSLSTHESVSEAHDGANSIASDLSKDGRTNDLLLTSMNQAINTASELQQNCFNGLMDVIKAVPNNQSNQTESKMTFLFSQLHSLENLFSDVKGQLMRLESSMHDRNGSPNSSNGTNFEVKVEVENEDTHERHGKRPFEEVQFEGRGERCGSEEFMKKIKLI